MTRRVFHVPLGAPFCESFARGLWDRFGSEQATLARTEVFVPTRRMALEIATHLTAFGSTLRPKIKLVSDLATDPTLIKDLPHRRSALERRLMLAQLIGKLSAQTGALASQSSRFALAASLDGILSEFQRAGLPFSEITTLDLSAHAQHWGVSQEFLGLLADFLNDSAPKDGAARLRYAIQAQAKIWQASAPQHPIILAGSTGSREDTLDLMQTIADLPEGAVVLPGVDPHLPQDIFNGLTDGKWGSDHPQSALCKAALTLGGFGDPWTNTHQDPPITALMSLALTPAPVTDRWQSEGPKLQDNLHLSTNTLTLLEAATPREEALSIALRLRHALESDEDAVLITPDRTLARQVTAQLSRWNIIPDDSAGRPLLQTPEGIFLRSALRLAGPDQQVIDLVAALKHPLAFAKDKRGDHLLILRGLEAEYLRKAGPTINAADIANWITLNHPDWNDWWAKISAWLAKITAMKTGPLDDLISAHKSAAETLFTGFSTTATISLWESAAGMDIRHILEELSEATDVAGELTLSDYAGLLRQTFSTNSIREVERSDPRIAIWGTLEARNATRDLVILGGLNEGTWPELPNPNPWLNRPMRKDVGLSAPERTVGLSAHDFQQATTANTVVLSRAERSGDAPTVPSRWLLRLTNLLGGLKPAGPKALDDMRARAEPYLEWARDLDQPLSPVDKAPRPAPVPPEAARPRKLPVTQIQTLIRDPYAIYARYVLRLRKLDPLGKTPDVMLRGSALHEVMEAFVKSGAPKTRQTLLETADTVLLDHAPSPISFHQWRARISAAADWLVDFETRILSTEDVLGLEIKGSLDLSELGFTLEAKSDRINLGPNGLRIIDYKSTSLPTDKVVKAFDKQLPLTMLIAEAGGFPGIDAGPVSALTYISLAGNARDVDPDAAALSDTFPRFKRLIAAYLTPDQPFIARTRPDTLKYVSDYDHLSRRDEWSDGDLAIPEVLQ